jgi:hypothetical protein
MKVIIKHIDSDIPKDNYDFYNDYINYLQNQYPLKKNVTIIFRGNRTGNMTTGVRNDNSEISVLSKGRMNRDILRTLTHEWIHEYQRTMLGRERGSDIGGQNEDEANAKSGELIKKFEKTHPDDESKMYD